MPPSPSKRRKTSPTTSIAVVTDASNSRSHSRPSTSSRASYQSPTKASLSRSHPTILARSPGRRSSEGRGKGLRQEVLLGKTKQATSTNQPQIPASQAPQPDHDGISVYGDGPATPSALGPPKEILSAVVTRAFANPGQSAPSQRSPLEPRQPSTRNDGGERAKSPETTTDAARLKFAAAVRHTHDFPIRESAAAEPELPPTPTQLGLSPKPDPPRGLAASSSPSSRGSRRSRLRNGQVESSSPLKPKEKMPATVTETVSREKAEPELAEEALESNVIEAEPGPEPQPDVEDSSNGLEAPDDITTKRRERDELKAQLVLLQVETAQLESALDGREDAEEDLDPDLLALLSTPNISSTEINERSSIKALKEPVALDVSPLAFLRAFAPGDLRLTTTTRSSSLHGRLYQAYILNISAPPPWPPHIFYATFRVTCDVESQRVISITGADIRPRGGAGIKELRHWIEARLKNPLHKFDAGTLIWGLGMWWKEAVARAHFFRHVDDTKAGKSTTTTTTTTATATHPTYHPPSTLHPSEIQTLLPYLGKSFIELIPAEPYSNRASTNEARKYRQPRLLLKWDLELDWAGEVHTYIDVAGAKVSASAGATAHARKGQGQEAGVREVFAALRGRKGLEVAVGEVVRICGGGAGGEAKGAKKRGRGGGNV